MDTVITILRGVSVTLGGLLLLAAFVLYEDEKKHLQSRLATCWIKVHDFQKQGVTRRAAFMRVVAEGVGTILDSVYGPRLFSFRTLAAAVCLSYSSAIFSILIFGEFYSAGGTNWSSALKFGFGFMAGPLLIALFDEKYQSYVSVALLAVCGAILVPASEQFGPNGLGKAQQAILIGATIVVMDLLLVGAIRWVSNIAASSQSFWRMIGCAVASIAIGAIAAPLPAYFAFGNSWTNGEYFWLVFFIPAFTNFFETLAALLFLFVAVGMVIHWLLWPLLSRLLYPLANENIFANRKTLGAIGIALITLGNKSLADWIRTLL